MKRICTVRTAVLFFVSPKRIFYLFSILLLASPLLSSSQPGNNNNAPRVIPELNSLWFKSFSLAPQGTLPLQLINFRGSVNDNKGSVQWTIAENETGNSMELEKSSDGVHFTTTALIFTTTKTGTENYSYKESIDRTSFYRLKMINKDNSMSYSNVIRLTTENDDANKQIRILQNPVSSSLQFTYTVSSDKASMLTIYTVSGAKVFSTQLAVQKGTNSYLIHLKPNMDPGIYLLELINDHERSICRFMKP